MTPPIALLQPIIRILQNNYLAMYEASGPVLGLGFAVGKLLHNDDLHGHLDLL